MSAIDLDQWPRRAPAHDASMESRAEVLRRRVAAYRCYLVGGSDINLVRQILREIALDEAELLGLLQGEPSDTPQQPGLSSAKEEKP